jgi:hypothetical protein
MASSKSWVIKRLFCATCFVSPATHLAYLIWLGGSSAKTLRPLAKLLDRLLGTCKPTRCCIPHWHFAGYWASAQSCRFKVCLQAHLVLFLLLISNPKQHSQESFCVEEGQTLKPILISVRLVSNSSLFVSWVISWHHQKTLPEVGSLSLFKQRIK